MFLFPWFDYGIDILKFEKSHFLAVRVIFGDFSPQNCNSITVRTWRKSCVNLDVINFFQQKIKNFLEKPLSYPEIVLWPPGTIWSLRKTILRKKSRKKSLLQGTLPLVTYLRDIYIYIYHAKRLAGGVNCVSDFFRLFFVKSSFWATKWSPEVIKLSPDSLEIFLKYFWKIVEKNLLLQDLHRIYS